MLFFLVQGKVCVRKQVYMNITLFLLYFIGINYKKITLS